MCAKQRKLITKDELIERSISLIVIIAQTLTVLVTTTTESMRQDGNGKSGKARQLNSNTRPLS